MVVDAVIGLRAGDIEPARRYLRFVERHRSRAVAEQAKSTLRRYAAATSWKDCERWPGWGYSSKPPAESTTTKRRTR